MLNAGKVNAIVWDAYVEDGGERIISAKSRLPREQQLRSGEPAILLVSVSELARKLLERGHVGNAQVLFVVEDWTGKRHETQVEVTHLEERAASVHHF